MDTVKVCLLDYGSGNVKSVFNLINYLRSEIVVSNDEKDIESCTHLILPGVGSFGTAMDKIKKEIPISFLEQEVVIKKKPFLGICVGLQVLFQKGYEFGEHDGLGWLDGIVEKLDAANNPLPHIGWNNIKEEKRSVLFRGLGKINDFYFVHSFAVKTDAPLVISTTFYGNKFCSAIQKDNIFGVQFHPEKSQKAGIMLMKNFLSLK